MTGQMPWSMLLLVEWALVQARMAKPPLCMEAGLTESVQEGAGEVLVAVCAEQVAYS